MQTEVVLGLGGNTGDRLSLLKQAVVELGKHFELLAQSDIYETAAWGGVARGAFLNQVVVVLTEKGATEILKVIQEIESQLGRRRNERWGDRTMDIDILYYGADEIDSSSLRIPHPHIADRKFVLVPLEAVLPEKKHPKTGKSPGQMLAECTDTSEVRVYEL